MTTLVTLPKNRSTTGKTPKNRGFTEIGKPSMVGRGGNKPSERSQSLKPNRIKASSLIPIYKTDSLRQIYDSYLHEKELNIKSAGLSSRLFIIID